MTKQKFEKGEFNTSGMSVIDSNGYEIADCDSRSPEDVYKDIANAQLLAASKELLKCLIAEVKEWYSPHYFNENNNSTLKSIAKAFGEPEFRDWMLEVDINIK